MTNPDPPPPAESAAGAPEPASATASPELLPRFSRKRLNRRQWKWAVGAIVVSALICGVSIAVNVVRVPYVSLSPGSVYSAPDAIAVSADGLTVYGPESELGFVTVGVSQKLTLWRFFFDSLDDRIDIYKEEIINRGGTRDEANRRNAELMQASQQSAVSLALEYLGLTEVTLYPSAETYECLVGGGEADGGTAGGDGGTAGEDGADGGTAGEPEPYIVFLPGDVVETADGTPIRKAADLAQLFDDLPEGGTVELGVRAFAPPEQADPSDQTDQPEQAAPSEKAEKITVSIAPEVTDRQSTGSFFFNVRFPQAAATQAAATYTCQQQQTWFAHDSADRAIADSVRLDAGEVSGPSAGLAFTLSVIDLLSEGNLTGGLKVATTGIVNSHIGFYPIKFFETQVPRPECGFNYGRICSVGGVTQKTTAVRHNGYDVFLVPEDGGDFSEAITVAGDAVKVIEVSTLHEAMGVLACLGGDPVAAAGSYSDAASDEPLDCGSLV